MSVMNWVGLVLGIALGVYLFMLVAIAKPLGAFMAKVYEGERTFLTPIVAPVEQGILSERVRSSSRTRPPQKSG